MLQWISKIVLASVFLVFAVPAHAGVIGSFVNTGYLHFDPFSNGSGLFDFAVADLANDGHSFLDLRTGAGVAANLGNVDAVYLPTGTTSARPSGAELDLIAGFLAGGGNVIVQADHQTYDAPFLSNYGATVSCCSHSPVIDNPFAPLTDGPHGTVTTLDDSGTWQINLSSGGFTLDTANTAAVLSAGDGLAAGSGNLIILGDINMFDGPGNTNGWTKADNAILFRNAVEFAVSGSSDSVPAPGALALLGLGLLGLGIRCRAA